MYYQKTKNVDKGTYVLSKDEIEEVFKAVELVKANPFAYEYFVNSDSSIELVHQLAIYFSYNGEECKALLDGVKIDHQLRQIQPFDLKTTSQTVYAFPKSFMEFGYYRQAAFYTEALKQDPVIKSFLEEGYTLLPYIFIVTEIRNYSTHPAIIYRTTPEHMELGLNGGTVNGKYYKGINQLLEDYRWHTDNNYWEMSRELFKNKGEAVLCL